MSTDTSQLYRRTSLSPLIPFDNLRFIGSLACFSGLLPFARQRLSGKVIRYAGVVKVPGNG
jgi:hypothetical protein